MAKRSIVSRIVKSLFGKDTYEKLFVQAKYYNLNRPHYIFTIPGIMKCYEVTPIVLLICGALTTEAWYFTWYYPWSRGEVLYTKTPAFERIDLEKPPQWKMASTIDYPTYKPLIEQKNVLHEMECEEWNRYQELQDMEIEIEYEIPKEVQARCSKKKKDRK